RRSRSAAACSRLAVASRPAADLSLSSASCRKRSASSRLAALRRLGVPTTKNSNRRAVSTPTITATHTQRLIRFFFPYALRRKTRAVWVDQGTARRASQAGAGAGPLLVGLCLVSEEST